MKIWCDVESTDLDKNPNSVLLEIALVATTDDLTIVDSISFVIRPDGALTMEPLVAEMHAQTGLLLELKNGKQLWEVEDECIRFMERVLPLDENGVRFKPDMAGASAHTDRNHLRRHMPQLEAMFTHRQFDITSLKEAYRKWVGGDIPVEVNPARVNGAPNSPPGPSVKTMHDQPHRAMYDLMVNIAEAKFIRSKMQQIGRPSQQPQESAPINTTY